MRKSSVPMAEPTMADPANAVEAAALLVEAVDAGTAVEAMRIVFSATAGWRRKQLAKQLQSRKPQRSSGAEELARLQSEVEKLQIEVAAKDAAMEKLLHDQEWLEEGRSLAYEQLLSDLEVPSSMSGSGGMITFPHFAEQLEMWHAASRSKVEQAEATVAKVTKLAVEVSEKYEDF